MFLRVSHLLSLLFILNAIFLSAQIKRQSVQFSSEEETVLIQPEFQFSAIVIKTTESLDSCFIITDSEKYTLHKNEHSSTGDTLSSQLIVFEDREKRFYFSRGSKLRNAKIEFIYCEPLRKEFSILRTENDNCLAEPFSITQSNWRTGLPEPNYNRIVNDVQHIIVHHSDTDNGITDYVNLVRSIYTFHTQSNGWSDIGYNYLIAPNGTIFKGRDPAFGEQSDVRGAHFCGKNTNVMGICLLGRFTNEEPTEEALISLEKLIAWKTNINELDPLTSQEHFENNLNIISGHRDGCATVCPGQMMYNLIPDLRLSVNNEIITCNENTEEGLKIPTVFEQGENLELSTKDQWLSSARLVNMQGKETVLSVNRSVDYASVSFKNVKTGFYIIKIRYQDKLLIERIMII